MARSRDQGSLKNDSAATRAIAHKLGRPVSTWSTIRQRFDAGVGIAQCFGDGFMFGFGRRKCHRHSVNDCDVDMLSR